MSNNMETFKNLIAPPSTNEVKEGNRPSNCNCNCNTNTEVMSKVHLKQIFEMVSNMTDDEQMVAITAMRPWVIGDEVKRLLMDRKSREDDIKLLLKKWGE